MAFFLMAIITIQLIPLFLAQKFSVRGSPVSLNSSLFKVSLLPLNLKTNQAMSVKAGSEISWSFPELDEAGDLILPDYICWMVPARWPKKSSRSFWSSSWCFMMPRKRQIGMLLLRRQRWLQRTWLVRTRSQHSFHQRSHQQWSRRRRRRDQWSQKRWHQRRWMRWWKRWHQRRRHQQRRSRQRSRPRRRIPVQSSLLSLFTVLTLLRIWKPQRLDLESVF